tara:strand:+ start:1068 stop:1217 length:150 start_codon:yes stop_codon:yes gene_type:complete
VIAPLLDLAGLPINFSEDEALSKEKHLADAESISLSPGEYNRERESQTD